MLAELQRAMTGFVLDDDRSVAGLLRSDLPAIRLAIYRNNVLGSLADVLAQAYPTIRRLLGGDGFAVEGRGYASTYPPCRPMLWSYGGGFPAWLEERPCTDAGPWLPDVARLDWAMHEALFAADAEPLDPARLAAVPPERAGGLRLMPHPSVRLVRSRWPLHAIWKGQPPAGPAPEAVLVGRVEGEVLCARLEEADGAVAAALLASRRLDEMVPAGGGDLQAVLGLLLQNRLLAGFALGLAPENDVTEQGEEP